MTLGDRIRSTRLPLSVISGPIIWALLLVIGYALVPVACQRNTNWIVLVLGAVAAVLTLTMGLIAFRGWRRFTREPREPAVTDLDEPEGLGEFFGSAGAIMSLLFFVLIASTAIYSFFLSPCPLITMTFP